MSTTARRRRGLRPVAAIISGAIGLAGAGLAAPAAAAPPTAAPLPGDSPAGVHARVSVQNLTPRDLVGHDATRQITVSGRITNSGQERFDAVRVRLQRDALISTRSELRQADTDEQRHVIHSCDWLVLTPGSGLPAGGLAPGRTQAFEYRCAVGTLAMTRIGIYPLDLHAEVSPDGLSYEPAGDVRTYLPSFPDGVTARTQVSWLWPLVDRPHRTGQDDRFVDDDLAGSVSPGGRLDRLLSVAEHAPPNVRLTLAIDPELVDELAQMEHGYLLQNGRAWRAGRHGAEARAWLDRVKRLAASHAVVALPYGDPDVVALDRAGVVDLARPAESDNALIAKQLGVTPSTQLAWLPGNAVTPGVLASLVRQGTRAVVLDAASLPAQPLTGPTPSSVAALPVPGGGRAVALVSDADLASVVRTSKGFPGGPRLAEQRYLAELAMITAEAPAKGRELVVVPPRRWNPDPVSAAAMLADTVSMSWLSSGSATELASQQALVDRGPLVYPEQSRRAELPADLVHAVADTAGKIADLRTALLDDESARQSVDPLDAALRMSMSSAWRDDPARGRSFVASVSAEISALRSGVYVVKPSGSGLYSLASSNSPLFVTIGNRLDVPVRIRLRISSRGVSDFSVGDVGEQVIPAHNRRTLQVPAHVERTGLFVVDAVITTPGGQPLGADDGAPVHLKVRSTAYGAIGLAITGAALALFLLLAIRRLLRHARRGRDGDAPTEGADDGTVRDDDPDGGPTYGGVTTGEATLGRAFDADQAFIPAERSSV